MRPVEHTENAEKSLANGDDIASKKFNKMKENHKQEAADRTLWNPRRRSSQKRKSEWRSEIEHSTSPRLFKGGRTLAAERRAKTENPRERNGNGNGSGRA